MKPPTDESPRARVARLEARAFEALFEQAVDPILIVLMDGTVVRANAAAALALGRSPEELVGMNRRDIVVSREDHFRRVVTERAQSGTVRAELVYRRADGTTFPVAITSAQTTDGAEPVAYVLFRDLTAERAAARALLESEQRFAAVFDRTPVAMALSRLPETTYVDVNDAWRALFEVGDADVVGKTGVQLGIATPEAWASASEAFRREGSLRNREVVRRTRAGQERILLLSMEPLSIGGKPHLISIAVDVTEDRRRTAELRSRN